jgi:osmotically-inducible protein OsmY
MKHIIISVLCLSVFTLSAIAQENPAADNTRKNERDRSGETQTSGDQSNSSQDTQTTAAIRRAVVKDKSLSATAKNVKIITANGTVTLRGPVKNDAEKTKIAELAQSAAGSAKIDNQLEVKASKSTKE